MKRSIVAVTLLALLVPASLSTAGSAAITKRQTHHFSLTFLGAQPSPDEAVYDVFGSEHGAAVQKLVNNAAGTGGTSTTRFYDGHGVTFSAETYTFGTITPDGLLPITGTGHYTSGTGRYRHLTGRFSFSGIYNSTNNGLKVKVTGTQRY